MSRGYEVKLGRVKIDFTRQTGQTISNSIVFSEGDIGTSLIEVELLNNDKIINLEGYQIAVNIIRKDKTHIVSDCTVLDSSMGLIEIELSVDALIVGVNNIEIVLIKEGRQLTSPPISYRVIDSLLTGYEVEISNEYPILLTLISDVQNVKTEYENLMVELEVTQGDIDDIMVMVGGL